MLKGVNKQILEITNTESPYFEKIIFFVRPSSQNLSSEKLEKEAEKISIQTKTKPPRQRITPKRVLSFIAYSLLGMGTGVAVSYIIGYIF
ncbi:MAG: hypothetical protein ACI4IL_08060 [Eubacterium sp.]